MKRIILIVSVLLFAFISCDKNENKENYTATVLGKGLDCGDSFLIQFKDGIQGLPENTLDNIFYEINLPEDFKIEGRQIFVEFREPENDEFMACTTLGLGYPQIFITKAE